MAPANHSTPLIYLTVNDGPSGVYTGQVIDVVHLLRKDTELPVRLVALVPLVLFRKHRKAIRSQMSDAIVIPMVPKLRNWRFNLAQLVLVFGRLGRCSVIARNPLAANLALTCRNLRLVKRVCYDGRGAVAAELAEYSPGNPLERSMPGIEGRAVCESDFRIAVSTRLVAHWQQRYGYASDKHVVIPCSYSGYFEELDLAAARGRRRDLGLLDEDIVLVFAGGTSGWQSAELFANTVSAFLAKSLAYKLICLSQDRVVERLLAQFPNQVRQFWLEPREVPAAMAAGDYGLLLREPTITNRVAAPVKFAEYLACGLPVICSDCIGDCAEFLKTHKAGFVVSGNANEHLVLSSVSVAEKLRIHALAEAFYSKRSETIKVGYSTVAEQLR
jgi:glycosyltransferase involved in cell wall biosynthesis